MHAAQHKPTAAALPARLAHARLRPGDDRRPQDCLARIMLGKRADSWDEDKRSLATIKAVMKKLFIGELHSSD